MVQPTRRRQNTFPSIGAIAVIAIFVCFIVREAFEGGWIDLTNIDPLMTTSQLSSSPDNVKYDPTSREVSFYEVGLETATDKVAAPGRLPGCLKNDASCTRPSCVRKECRPWGHFYHTMYQQKFGKWTLPGTKPFQFLEIGFFQGSGYDAYNKFFSNVKGAELHSMEISCIEPGPREEGKWPWGNFASKNSGYESLLKKNLLHCGDASNVTWLNEVYTTKLHRSDAPPLKLVVEDASHISSHMATSVFFWFPRIEPGGFMVIEDIQPIADANLFRTQFMPQIMSDLHFCGDPEFQDQACFPTLYPLLQSIHCEMHICVLERNEKSANYSLSLELSKPPPNALDLQKCYSFAKAKEISRKN
ncbi:hypothetical protein IV203_018656 [Nitzschia inconspicua]|uniref:Methyltransferase n=1 Tax=Nitzschia inconspicua TaxID=303405 RepID=A0A9K3M2F7_9STRA|nr:hypothetical protein IV203_018656 [Nitzschia inconspicua]